MIEILRIIHECFAWPNGRYLPNDPCGLLMPPRECEDARQDAAERLGAPRELIYECDDMNYGEFVLGAARHTHPHRVRGHLARR